MVRLTAKTVLYKSTYQLVLMGNSTEIIMVHQIILIKYNYECSENF